jgi:radical SAM protein with 4Fe4S-binding SPASM domain
MIQYIDDQYRYKVSFNLESGLYVRTSVLDEQGFQMEEEPFRGSYPHLLDIGIMGHCAHGLSGKCLESGVECYQSGRTVQKPHMPFNAFQRIIDESNGRTFQVALGGRGDPDQHPDFLKIIQYAREKDVVPNFTTSGFGLDLAILPEVKKYCGAVAVSYYRNSYTTRAINGLLAHGIKTNIHYVLSDSTIDEAIQWLEKDNFPQGLNRVIFLLHKPAGLGRKENVLKAEDQRVQRFFKLFNEEKNCNRAGFDSCSAPALINFAPAIQPFSYDTCEGGRFSAYISPDSKIYPCSFDQSGDYALDLSQTSIEKAWNSMTFEGFRNKLRRNCPTCSAESLCKGGCPLMREIVLCNRQEKCYGDEPTKRGE